MPLQQTAAKVTIRENNTVPVSDKNITTNDDISNKTEKLEVKTAIFSSHDNKLKNEKMTANNVFTIYEAITKQADKNRFKKELKRVQ